MLLIVFLQDIEFKDKIISYSLMLFYILKIWKKRIFPIQENIKTCLFNYEILRNP